MKNIRNESGYPINVPSNVPAPVEADDHRHSSPCYIHNGECINPYHIHAEEAEKEQPDIDEILRALAIANVGREHPTLTRDAKQAIFSLLASEAVPISHTEDAVTLSKLKAIMEIKE